MASSSSSRPPPVREPVLSPTLPLGRRIIFAIRLWTLKLVVSVVLRVVRLRRSGSSALVPNETRVYQVRPTLEHRIFWPASHNRQSGDKLPLFISIHGGGFALADPSVDDRLCRTFADQHGLLVVSLDYRKAPRHPFPAAVEDVVALVPTVLDDTRLPIDHSRVVIGGYSAGGNLSLAAVQFPDIRARINGVLAVYPATDMSGKFRGPYRATRDGRRDLLERDAKLFTWSYMPPGTDRTNPLLSPVYAPREDFPRHIFFVGAECDILVQEAETLARRLAGFGDDELSGTRWQKNGIRWKLYWDMQHAFTHLRYTGDLETARKAAEAEYLHDAAEWMYKDVFAK